MSLPVRHLPVLQNWECQGCTHCCREYDIAVTEEERRRIAAQGWEREAGFEHLPLFVRRGHWWKREYRLNHRPDGACVFLSEQGRCRIHERFGSEAKPLACRLYPFVLVPAHDHWRVGVRFACPAAAANQGKPLAEQADALRRDAGTLTQAFGIDPAQVPSPSLQPGQRLDWSDLLRFVQALLKIIRGRSHRVEHRLRQCLALAGLCRQARFGQLQGNRLTEFLQILSADLETEVPPDPQQLLPPTWVGHVLFRMVLALLVRKDQGQDKSVVGRRRSALLRAGWRFARGKGLVPRVHGRLPVVAFDEMEKPAGVLPPVAEQVLERYYAVKIESLQFCGAANFDLDFWDGLHSLALTLPAILWLTRAFSDLPREEAVTRAIGMVDLNFGFNPALGARHQRMILRILARRGELERLVAWYSR